MSHNIQPVAVIGCGTIGSSWATLFAARGLNVRLYDVNPAALSAGKRNAEAMLERLFAARADAGRDELSDARGRLHAAPSPAEALDGAGFVQESVLERYPIKREAHELIERFAPADAIIASSASGLLARQMQEGLAHPERFLVAHPFNPPHLIPLVELVPGPLTGAAVLQAAFEFYISLNKTPIVLRKEVPGHIANRLAVAVWREAIDLVANGVASLEDVDKALYAGPGLRWSSMGQHMIYHVNGGPRGYAGFFEHFGPQIETWLADMAQWTEIPAEARAEVLKQMSASLRGRTLAELEATRDEKLQRVLQALYPQEQPAEA